MQSNKVALFSTSFVPYSQTFIYDEITHHLKYEVDVFTKSYQNAYIFPYDRVFTPGKALNQLFYQNRMYWPGFDKQFKSNSYNLIHAHFGTGAVYALHYKRKFGLPLVTTFHGNDIGMLMGTQRLKLANKRYVRLSKSVFELTDKILAVSTELAEIIKDLSGRDDIEVFPLGVDLKKFNLKTDYAPLEQRSLKLILIGRFTQKKGHIYALRAVKKLVELGQPVTLTFIGSGDLKADCVQFVEQHSLQNHVFFSGVLTPNQVADAIRDADVALVPSIVADDLDREGSPTTVKEASACGVPVIGTYHAGISETIEDQKTGFLIPERHVNALVDRILAYIKTPSLIEQHGRAARVKMEQEFNIQDRIAHLENIYDQLS